MKPTATRPIRLTIQRIGKSWHRPTLPTISIARPVLPLDVARNTESAAGLVRHYGERIRHHENWPPSGTDRHEISCASLIH